MRTDSRNSRDRSDGAGHCPARRPATRARLAVSASNAFAAVAVVGGLAVVVAGEPAGAACAIPVAPVVFVGRAEAVEGTRVTFRVEQVLDAPTVPAPSVDAPSVPEPGVPEPAVPEPSVPEPSVRELAVPELAVPASTVPDQAAPTPTVQGLAVGSTAVVDHGDEAGLLEVDRTYRVSTWGAPAGWSSHVTPVDQQSSGVDECDTRLTTFADGSPIKSSGLAGTDLALVAFLTLGSMVALIIVVEVTKAVRRRRFEPR